MKFRAAACSPRLTPAESSRTIDALIERSARAFLPSRPLKNASVVQVHYGSARFTARILLLDRRELLPGETAIARLRFTKPAFVFVGDRFIIRDSSGRQTIAGGVVLNPDAGGTKFRSTAERSFLQARAAAPDDLITLLLTQLQRDQIVRRAALLLQSSFSAGEIADAVDRLVSERKAFTSGTIVADLVWWAALRQRALDAIDAQHEANPHHVGLDLARLRDLFAKEIPEMFEALVADLCDHGAVRVGDVIKRAAHRPTLPPQLQAAGEVDLARVDGQAV